MSLREFGSTSGIRSLVHMMRVAFPKLRFRSQPLASPNHPHFQTSFSFCIPHFFTHANANHHSKLRGTLNLLTPYYMTFDGFPHHIFLENLDEVGLDFIVCCSTSWTLAVTQMLTCTTSQTRCSCNTCLWDAKCGYHMSNFRYCVHILNTSIQSHHVPFTRVSIPPPDPFVPGVAFLHTKQQWGILASLIQSWLLATVAE